MGICEYTAHSSLGGFVAPTLDSFTIVVHHGFKSQLVASGSLKDPNPQGTFATAPGDVVTVRLYSVCIAPGACGSFGTVEADDRAAATPATPPLPSAPGGMNPSPSPSSSASPGSSSATRTPAFCLAQTPFSSQSGATRQAARCDYKATSANGGWNVFTIGSWKIDVTHAGKTKTVASGDIDHPNAFGSFATAPDDVVSVRIFSICTAGKVFCGSAGTVLIGDRPSGTPSFPQLPATPVLPVVPGVPSVGAPSTGASTSSCNTAQTPAVKATGAGRVTTSCFYTAKKTTGGFFAPTIGQWDITAKRKTGIVTLASGGPSGANPQGTYTTVPGEQVTVRIYSICTPSNVFCGSLGSVSAADR